MFNRLSTKIDLGEGLWRHKVQYASIECEPFSQFGYVLQQELLKAVVASTELLQIGSGNGKFERLTMFHDGSKWMIELTKDDQQEV